MASDRPFALHLTWTCYGTWLPGDRRGHVSPILLSEGGSRPRENVPGTPHSPAEPFTHRRALARQKWPTVYLTIEQALVVAGSLSATAQARGWRILRGAVMANHVHLVVMDCPNDGPAVRRILKGASQAALNDLMGHNQKWWTQGGSDRYKNDWPAIETAVQYVADQPGILAAILDKRAAGFIPAEVPQPALAGRAAGFIPAEVPQPALSGRAAGFIPAEQPQPAPTPAAINPLTRPRMTHARAAVLRLLDRFQVRGSPLALQQVHELLYFLQAAGEPLNLCFTKEASGPYADNLRYVLHRFEGHFTAGFSAGSNSPTTPIQLLPNALKEAEDFAGTRGADGRETIARLDRVTHLIEGFESPYWLELLAGIHWVATHPEEQATDLDSIVRGIHGWNDRKRRIIKPEPIRIAWQRLEGKGWLLMWHHRAGVGK